MKILSTPTANTRKGMISKIMRVAGTPINPKVPEKIYILIQKTKRGTIKTK